MARFNERVSAIARTIQEDIAVVRAKDPAVTSAWEVLCYPHLHALWLHRLAHLLYRHDRRLTARMVALFGRLISGGIDIHPGARIGRRLFIDHGTGVVIGETAEIGDDVMLYHLVTLGSVGWWTDVARGPGAKRHPTLGDGVIVGTGASVLGPVEIGAGSLIGAHAVVLCSLPAATRVQAGQVTKASVASVERMTAHDTALPHHLRSAQP
jgi:serine O-acetyltransferase